MKDDTHYSELADRAERGDLRPTGTALTGAAAAAAGAQDLMWATGTDTLEDATVVARRGRPRLGPGDGRSPVVRARVSEDEYTALADLAQRTGRTRSDLVREGVRLVLRSA